MRNKERKIYLMSLTEKKWQEGGLSNNLKCKLVWSGKQELIGNAEKQHTELRRKKKRTVYGGGNHKKTKQLCTKIY